MKKTIIMCMAAMLALAACNKSDNEENTSTLSDAERQELMDAINERDQLLELFNEIAATTEEIKGLENIVTINTASGEGMGKQVQVSSNLQAIKQELADRRQRIAELEDLLKNSKQGNQKLLSTLETLKQTIEDQETTISTLSQKLGKANARINELDKQVNDLTNEVTQVTQERDETQAQLQEQTDLNNTVYYAIGSKKELKAHNIVEGGGFLKKSKAMQGDFDKSFFTAADKRTLTMIPLHSKKAKVVTTFQPKNSYTIQEDNGQKVLVILNPDEFWGLSNYLVVQID